MLNAEQCQRLIVIAYNQAGGQESAKAIIEMPQQSPPGQQPPINGIPGWCICGKCRPMPTPNENKCCRQKLCMTLQPSFQSLVLDRDALSVAIVGRMDVLADRSDFSNQGYRFAAYRQYILWQNGYLGRGNRRVVPSCATCSIRQKHPRPDGVYTGFWHF